MKTIWNKTTSPLRIQLHGGRTLHLGPNKTGQVADEDVERPSIRRQIEAGDLVLVEDASAEEVADLPEAERSAISARSQRKPVIPTGGRTAGGRRREG